jgi:tRNA pseudouridine32 synthase/23S rRNA pseudouridine746 synthase
LDNSKQSELNHFISFKSDLFDIELPNQLSYPFYYEPHPLALLAAGELKAYLENQKDWTHNFGFEGQDKATAIGKMFGVLVVKNSLGQLGYLAAFSGKLAESNQFDVFVPPVFDTLAEEGFYKQGESLNNETNAKLLECETNPDLLELLEERKRTITEATTEIEGLKTLIRQGKKERKTIRTSLEEGATDRSEILENLRRESIKEQYTLKDVKSLFDESLKTIEEKIGVHERIISALKEERKTRSSALQQQIFTQYSFLNARKESKSLGEIFSNASFATPPAGAGECAAPKLFHYAFSQNLQPIALAEFWWGQSPKGEVRVHGQYYPACRGKCEPILGHMLTGLKVEANPMLLNPAEGKMLKIVFEDESIIIINKPAEFLSVPGKSIDDSVYSRIRDMYPEADGPLLVHRLDMSTSGILLVAKNREAHRKLQDQFIRRKVSKRYVALLNGIVEKDEGSIDLPLRVDLDDRPRQMVCNTYGKSARTNYTVIERVNGKTRVYFYPVTGRTHQLRVHSAHSLGLNCPIVGDDLYGLRDERLCLHAESLTFKHPKTREMMTFQVDPEF